MPKIFGLAACVSLCVTIHAVHEGPKATFEIIQQVYMHIDFLSFITRVSACVLNVCFCWHDSDTTVTLIYDCPAVGEFFTPFPISARLALCCYRNIDSRKLNNASFLHPTWHKKLTWTSLWLFVFLFCPKLPRRMWQRFAPELQQHSSLTPDCFIFFIRSLHLVLSVFS